VPERSDSAALTVVKNDQKIGLEEVKYVKHASKNRLVKIDL
jgi:hypothetical protein